MGVHTHTHKRSLSREIKATVTFVCVYLYGLNARLCIKIFNWCERFCCNIYKQHFARRCIIHPSAKCNLKEQPGLLKTMDSIWLHRTTYSRFINIVSPCPHPPCQKKYKNCLKTLRKKKDEKITLDIAKWMGLPTVLHVLQIGIGFQHFLHPLKSDSISMHELLRRKLNLHEKWIIEL